MYKFILSVFFAFSLTLSSAHAKVCFLPGIFSGDSCLTDEQYAKCEGFNRTTPCPSGQEEISCSREGRTYYKCYCRADSYRLEDYPKYLCKSKKSYSNECGCAAKDLMCKPEYKYEGDGFGHCKDFHNANGIGPCVLPSGKVYYRDCECDDSYDMTCRTTGTLPGEEIYRCTDTTGRELYSECLCDETNNWFDKPCEDSETGCTEPLSTTKKDTHGGVCYQCAEAQCEWSSQINLDTYLCGRVEKSKIVTDCTALGYIEAPYGKCPKDTELAGEVGILCPFDRNFMYCKKTPCDPEIGQYPNQESCEGINEGAVCTEDINGCFIMSSCKTNLGYKKNNSTGFCEAVGCASGYQTGITCGADETRIPNAMSGGEDCVRCECHPDNQCVYTYQQYDDSNIVLSGVNKTPVYAGNAELTNKCCNGYYATCNSNCTGRDLTDMDANAESYTVCEACGSQKYTINRCRSGYDLNDNTCVLAACDVASGYSAAVQTKENCQTAEGLYAGAQGWSLEYERGVYGNTVTQGDKYCTKCACYAPRTCIWNETNKGKNGILDPQVLCCNGAYAGCRSEAPDTATAAACNDPHAVADMVISYEACNFSKVCVIGECEKGYTVVNNVCEATTCESGYTSSDKICAADEEFVYQLSDTGAKVQSGNKFCTKCSCPEPNAPSKTDACRFNEENKGNASISGKCCNGYYKTCQPANGLISKPTLTAMLGNPKYEEVEACGETYYRLTSCDASAGYELNNNTCKPIKCSTGYTEGLENCSGKTHPEGWNYEREPNRAITCGKCTPKEYAFPYAENTARCEELSKVDAQYWKLENISGYYSGDTELKKCTAKSCSEIDSSLTLNCEQGYASVPSGQYYNVQSAKFEECKKCIDCDNTQGYYASVPTGAAYLKDGSCYKPIGCAAGFYTEQYIQRYTDYIEFTGISFNVGTKQTTCYTPAGCKEGQSTTDTSELNHFIPEMAVVGNVVCHYAKGCALGYVSTCDQEMTDVKTLGGYTCGICPGK